LSWIVKPARELASELFVKSIVVELVRRMIKLSEEKNHQYPSTIP
jgi:hypothetical protein